MKTYSKYYLILLILLVFDNNINAQKYPIDLSSMNELEVENCYIQILPKYEYYKVTTKVMTPNPNYPISTIKKYYDLELKENTTGGDSALIKIHPAEYAIIYDTILIEKESDFRVLEEIRGDTIVEFWEVKLMDTLLLQCSKCIERPMNFNAFCKKNKPAILVKKREFLQSSKAILFEQKLPKRVVDTLFYIINPPYEEYKTVPLRVISSYTKATSKVDNPPKGLVILKDYEIVKYLKPYACYSGWTWKKIKCLACQIEDDIFSGTTTLLLQNRLREVGYSIQLTNIIDENLLEILTEMDLKILKNKELIEYAEDLIGTFTD